MSDINERLRNGNKALFWINVSLVSSGGIMVSAIAGIVTSNFWFAFICATLIVLAVVSRFVSRSYARKAGFHMPMILIAFATLASTSLGSEPRAVAAVALAYDVTTAAANVVDIVPSEPAKPQPTPEQPEIDYTRPVSYKAAHEAYTQSKRPMVVMVTASWCQYCPAVKSRLTEMARHGEMEDASLVVLDYDHDEMGRKVLPRGGSLPYVAVYFHNRSGKEDVKRCVSTSQIPAILGTR